MPVAVGVFYSEYATQIEKNELDLSGTCCPKCEASLVLTSSRVSRNFVLLEQDAYDCLTAEMKNGVVALARCGSCKKRIRVLPVDILPYKTYSLPVIEHLLSNYRVEGKGLRPVVWDLHGNSPSHTSLHGWLEGMGAYALGRPGGEVSHALPSSAVRIEVEQHIGRALEKPDPIPPARYRSQARRERLEAAFSFLFTCMVVTVSPPEVLAKVSRLLLLWGARRGIGFRSGIRYTPFEHTQRQDIGYSTSLEKGGVESGPT